MYALAEGSVQYDIPETPRPCDPVDESVRAIVQDPRRQAAYDAFMWHTIGEPGNYHKQPELSELYDVEPYTITQTLLSHGNHDMLLFVGHADEFTPDVSEYYFAASADLESGVITQWDVVGANYNKSGTENKAHEVTSTKLILLEYAHFMTLGQHALRPYRPKDYRQAEVVMSLSADIAPAFVLENKHSPLVHLSGLFKGMKRYHETKREHSDMLALEAARRHTMKLVTL